MNFAPDNSVGRVSIANHGRVVKKFSGFVLIFYFCDFCAFLRPYQFLCNAIMKMG
jgi:hypothetical protein